MHCLNCGNTFEGNYCPHCGQTAKTKRLHLTEMVNNFVGSFVGGDNKFAKTCRELLVRPGHMVRDYLLGKRAAYYNPLQMFVFTLTVYAVISYVLGVSTSIFDEMATADLIPDEDLDAGKISTFIINCVSRIYSNKLYGNLLTATFSVPPYEWLFRKCKLERPDGQLSPLNFTEQFYAQIYHSCIVMMVSIMLLPFCLIKGSDSVVGSIYQVTIIIYIIVLYKQLLGISWKKSICLNVLAVILTVLFMCVSMGVVGDLAGLIDSIID